jgi:uncharacterized protein (UPF0548 family)
MFLLSKPSTETVSRFLSSVSSQTFSYSQVGATNGTPPTDYILDHNRIQLGVGSNVYERAIAALQRWRQFDLGWVSIVPDTTPLEVGNTVAIRAKTFGVWSLSACRIVYVMDESTPLHKFGFAYGTLNSHVERGEERFTVELHEDGSVWYDILAFSQPNQLLVRMGYPLARKLQKRFARESLSRMVAIANAPNIK